MVKLKAFSKFENTAEALEAASKLIESAPTKGLRKFLRAHCEGETLAVADSKLGNAIKEKLVCSGLLGTNFYCFIWSFRLFHLSWSIPIILQKIECIHNNAVMELMRGVRSQLTELISGLPVQDLAPMSLGLSHSLSRYKLKFSAEKVFSLQMFCKLWSRRYMIYSSG